MLSKSLLKETRLLQQKKYRDARGLFVAEGPKMVNELLAAGYKVKNIFGTREFFSPKAYPVLPVTENELERLSALTAPNKVVGVFEMAFPGYDLSLMMEKLVLALDDIRDPGNLGTIIRIADWFGIGHILCSESSVDLYNPKVVQATMGSIARVNVHYVNLEKALEDFEPVFGAVLNGKNIYKEKLAAKGVILLGNESNGVSDTLTKLVTHKISVPAFGKAESLNVAAAAAVICSEFRRR